MFEPYEARHSSESKQTEDVGYIYIVTRRVYMLEYACICLYYAYIYVLYIRFDSKCSAYNCCFVCVRYNDYNARVRSAVGPVGASVGVPGMKQI